ncbi:hypothetical protein STEG23_005596, partial [Scotinomys teguina]
TVDALVDEQNSTEEEKEEEEEKKKRKRKKYMLLVDMRSFDKPLGTDDIMFALWGCMSKCQEAQDNYAIVVFCLHYGDSLCIKLGICLSGDLFPKTIGMGSTFYDILDLDLGV